MSNDTQIDGILEREIDTINEGFDTIKSKIKYFEEGYKDIILELDQANKIKDEYNALSDKFESVNVELNTLNIQFEASKAEVISLKNKVIENERFINNITKEKTELNDKYTILNEKSISQSNLINEYVNKIQDLEKNLKEAQSFEKENNILKSTINILNQEIELMRVKIEANKQEQNSKAAEINGKPLAPTPAKNLVSLTKDELIRWEKKIKDSTTQVKNLENQIKSLEIQNSTLKLELEEKNRISTSSKMKHELSLEGLEERCKALQSILDSSSKHRENLEAKVKQLEDQNVILKVDFQAKDEEVKSFRQVVKDKFEMERRYTELIQQFENYKNRYVKYEEEIANITEIRAFAENMEIQKNQLEHEIVIIKLENEDLKTKINDLEKELNGIKIAYEEEKAQNKKILDEYKNKSELLDQNSQVLLEVKSQLEDLIVERDILTKKYQTEIRELRNTLQADKTKYDTILEEKVKLESEINVLKNMAQTPKNSQSANSVHGFFKKIDAKQEKIIMEALSRRVQDLERDNFKLQFNIKVLEAKCVNYEKSINDKSALINTFLTECCDKLPLAAEFVGKIEKDDAEFLKSLKKFNIEEIQNLAEKTYLENIRLKRDLSMLGSELNKVLRVSKSLA